MKETKKEKITLKNIKSTAELLGVLKNSNDKDYFVLYDTVFKILNIQKKGIL